MPSKKVKKKELKVWLDMPVITLRGLVVYPKMVLQFDVGREKSLLALKQAIENDQLIFLVAQKNIKDEDPNISTLFPVGVVANIRQFVKQKDDSIRVIVEGLTRASITNINQSSPFLIADIKEVKDKNIQNKLKAEAMVRETKLLFEKYLEFLPKAPSDIAIHLKDVKDPGHLVDYIASNVMLDSAYEKDLICELSPIKRLEKMMQFLKHEIDILKIESELSFKVGQKIDKNQKEYYLREQMKIISKELGSDDDPKEETIKLKKEIEKLKVNKKIKTKLLNECDKLSRMPYGSHEISVIINYLEECLALPWNKASKTSLDVKKAQRILDREHYGLTEVKEKVLENLAVKKLVPNIKGQIMCLVGPPGVGKTSIARSIANATNMKYARIALGGMKDESEIRGHRKTYIGAMPGRIMAAIKEVGCNNPLILLDEIDKLGKDFNGDPTSALLEALDPEQNNTFYDHYIDLPFDLSNATFIATANDPSAIPEALYDRMDVIEVSGYTSEEKFKIAKQFLLPKQLKKHGMTTKIVKITDDALKDIIESYTREAGVRKLERKIMSVLRKCARKIAEGEIKTAKVDVKKLRELLGPVKFRRDHNNKKSEIGVATGLAWTSVGGETLPVEVAVMPGRGNIELTGSLGDVMKESAKAAISCVRLRCEQLSIDEDFYKKYDIHIHVPEGAVPKDGPSAGITITTAVVSALSNKPVKNNVAMTGEVTLRGRVLPIGGLKEKAMAAYRYGVKTVIIPKENEPDLQEVDSVVKENLNFVTVENIDKVLEHAIENDPCKKIKTKTKGKKQSKIFIPETKEIADRQTATID